MPGAVPTNLHEGSRSEYLAQYVFASFGTAAAIPHHEDTGVDLHCTITDKVGGRSWPRSYFSVQVKSTLDPWVFDGQEAVRWLIEHPLPLFLTIVDKTEARLRVYHTLPRFLVWSCPPLPDRLELVPGTGAKGRLVDWKSGTNFSLGAPILDFTIARFLDDCFRIQAEQVLRAWVAVELENLRMVDAGVHLFTMPAAYCTNEPTIRGIACQGATRAPEESVRKAASHLRPCLEWLGAQMFSSSDIRGATRAALLWRHLFREDLTQSPGFLHGLVAHLHRVLGKRDRGGYHYDGLDRVGEAVDRLLDRASHAIGGESAQDE